MTARGVEDVFLMVMEFSIPAPTVVVRRRGHRVLIGVDVWADRFLALQEITRQLGNFEMDCVHEALGWPYGMVPLLYDPGRGARLPRRRSVP